MERTRGDLSGKFGPVLHRPTAERSTNIEHLAATVRRTPAFAAKPARHSKSLSLASAHLIRQQEMSSKRRPARPPFRGV